MAHTLTEVASFDPTVTVPDGTDSRVNAAEVVQGIAQALANRSRFLKQATDGSAQLAASNTFTASLNSFVSIFASSTVLANDVSTQTLEAAGNISSNTGDITAGAEFKYNGTRTTVQSIDISTGSPDPQVRWTGTGGLSPILHCWSLVSTVPGTVTIPLRLPRDATLVSVDALVTQSVANNISLTVWRQGLNWSAPAAPTLTQLGSTIFSSTVGFTKLSLTGLSAVVANTINAYFAELSIGVASATVTDNGVFALRISFTDPGPRNG